MATSLYNQQIPNLIGGVSQQPDNIRFQSQSEEQVNFYPSTSLGLIKRSPSDLVTEVSGNPSGAYMFTLKRPDEDYVGLVQGDGTVRMFDSSGVEQTFEVNAPNPLTTPGFSSYLAQGDASDSIRTVSIGDSVVLINTSVEVGIRNGVTSPDRDEEALVYVTRGEYGKTYAVYVVSDNDTLAATYTTPDGSQASHTLDADSSNIASQIASGLQADATAGTDDWNIEVRGNLIHITNATTGFQMSTEDGLDDTAMYPIKGKANLFEDLPRKAPPGFVVAIVGGASNVAGQPYYVKAEQTGTSQVGISGWPAVVWEECAAPGLQTDLDETTLPLLVRRNANGNFELKHPESEAEDDPKTVRYGWGIRTVGDNDSAPFPSFAGRKINGGFFFKNRLGFFSGINVALSEAGDLFNFFPTATATLLDSDPIDVALSSPDSSEIYHAIPFQNQVMLSTESVQFSLRAEGSLTLRTVNIAQTTSINVDKNSEPVSSGRSLFMASRNGESTEVNEYFVDEIVDVNSASTITSHIPTYIPWSASSLKASRDGRHVVMAVGDTLYVYKYLWQGNEKAQSAWFRVELSPYRKRVDDPEGDVQTISMSIQAVEFIDNRAFVLVQEIGTAGGFRIVSFELTDSVTEGDTDFNIYLDSRMFNPPNSGTTYTLPVSSTTQDLVCIDISNDHRGEPVEIVSRSGNQVTLEYEPSSVVFGYPYECFYKFSKMYMRDRQQGGTAVTTGDTHILRLLMNYSDTSDMTVDVDIQGRSTRSTSFYGRTRGAITNIFGATPLATGVFPVPVRARAKSMNATLRSDTHLPCNVQFVDIVFRFNSNQGRSI